MTSEQAQRVVELVEYRPSTTHISIRYTTNGSVRVILEYGRNAQSTHVIHPSGGEEH